MSKHPWKAKLSVGIAMLAIAFLGMVVTDVNSEGGWDYWKWAVPIYAILSLWLSWYVKHEMQVVSPISLRHEILHWVGVIAAVFLVSFLVHLGTLSRFSAGLFNLIILALGVFLAGVYIESTFLIIGLLMGIFALLTATVLQYLYAFIIPLIIAGLLILAISVYLSHRSHAKKP